MNKKIRIFLIVFAVLFVGIVAVNILSPTFVTRAKDAWKVLINGKPSKVTPKKAGKMEYIPLNFPLEEGEQVWEVKMKYNPETKKVEITKVNKKKEVRGDTKCELCNGTGKCQACYPPGSGKNIQGDPCPACDGTGDCMICNGEGSY